MPGDIRRTGKLAGDPADLLPMVFSRPAEALARARALLAGDLPPHDASIAYQVIGLVERDFGDVGASLRPLRQALRMARRSGSREREGDVLASLGIALIHCGRSAAGLSMLDGAARITRGQAAARVLFRRANALWILGRHQQAMADVRRALPALRRAGDTVWTARALTLRGLVHLALGALQRADQDLDAAQRQYATTGQEHESAIAQHNRGVVAFRVGDLPTALRHVDEAAQRCRALGEPMPNLTIDRCAVLLAAGLAREALDEADAGIGLMDSRGGLGAFKAELLLTAARAALAAGDLAGARSRAAAAHRLFAAQRRHWWTVHSRLLLLRCRFAAGEAAIGLLRAADQTAQRLAALDAVEATQAGLLAGQIGLAVGRRAGRAVADRHLAAAARARHRGPPLARVSGWLAEALRADAAGQTRRTLAACRQGVALLSRHRLTLGASELRAQATAHGTDLAALALRVCLRTGSARRLLVWSEHWRASALAVPPVRPPDDVTLRADLARYRDLGSRLEEARADGAPAAALQREQRRIERRISSRTRHASGDGGPGAEADRPLDVPALLAELGSHGGRLVELVEVDGDLYVVLCGDGAVRRFRAGRIADVAVEVDHARAALRRIAFRAPGAPDAAVASLASAGRRLEDRLLGPAGRSLAGGPVVVVPPGRLHGVPWALLPSLQATAFGVAPSARAWLRARAAHRLAPGDVVLVRGPGLGTQTSEIATIATMYDRATVLEHGAATAATVLSALDGCGLAHIAAHGTFRSDSPLFSALRMDDGPLTVHDFEGLAAAPHRLVLPSCDSARLAPAGVDELLGLVAALLPLGTEGIVASVVPVDDEATAELMVDLHRALRHGVTMAEALVAVRAKAGEDPLVLATASSFVAFGPG